MEEIMRAAAAASGPVELWPGAVIGTLTTTGDGSFPDACLVWNPETGEEVVYLPAGSGVEIVGDPADGSAS